MDRYSKRVDFKVDARMAQAILSELRHMPEKMKDAEKAAVEKTQRTAKSKLSSAFRAVITPKKDVVDDRIRAIRHPRRGSAYAVIRVSKYQISLKEYSKNYLRDYVGFADQKGKRRGGRAKTKKREEKLQAQGSKPGREPRDGASWQIYTSKSGGKKQRHKRFITTMSKSGNIIIIKRTPGSTKGGKQARAPRDYRTAYGPSLAWIDKQKNIIRPLLDSVIGPALEKNMRSQVDRFLGRKKSQRPNA